MALNLKQLTTLSILLVIIGCTLTGCASSNYVTQIEGENALIKYTDEPGYEDRFSNIYESFKAYPVTCTNDCYPASGDIECESNMQDCRFVGNNPAVNLHTGFTVKWLGHASFLLKTAGGEQILIDPVFGQFDWPVNWAFRLAEGISRNEPAKVDEDKLAQTDAVVYSHIHYDHFNKADIAELGTKPEYLVPLGFAAHFPNRGYTVNEMAWYTSKNVGKTSVHFVPAHHFSNRIWVPYLYEDNDATLWGGWVFESEGRTLFFAGDTGYSPHFKDINARFGDIDVCLLPIASYFSETSPKWYRKVHTTPEDAIVAAQDLGCKAVVPWGFGNTTWMMGDKTSHSALFRLMKMKKQLSPAMPWVILNEGEQVSF
ncbi:MBL fold metallo-hydrolase [Alteromonas portus]|uniref:MBL fold metallo-hydrolase n=1 Tax=Alteromonas portus TaxID=2565549 RepID=A0A4V5NQC2_9ALTE|nr:MBL fold metallo-hydrolase [Alteromonas portus]TKB02826.1 MBL fold metallo-hydrolase [Alteromonas portus]